MTGTRSLLAAGLASLALPGLALAQPAEDTIIVGLSADITTFEPAAISSRDNANIVRHIFGTLYSIGADGSVVPDLAENLEISEDGLAYVYTMREGLTCHNGEPLTAEDAAYSFNRAKDPANAFTGNTPGFVFSSVGFQDAVALDEQRVQINIARRNPIAFGLLAEVYIHCRDSYERMSLDEAAANPNALPPLSRTACTSLTRAVGRSRSVSRVPGAEPRTSTPPTAPSSQMTTVQPVAADALV